MIQSNANSEKERELLSILIRKIGITFTREAPSLTRLFLFSLSWLPARPPVPGLTPMVTAMEHLLSGYLVLRFSLKAGFFSLADEARRLIIDLHQSVKSVYQLHLTPEIFSSLHSAELCEISISSITV